MHRDRSIIKVQDKREREGGGRGGWMDCLGMDGLGLSYVSSTAAYSGGKRRQQ